MTIGPADVEGALTPEAQAGNGWGGTGSPVADGVGDGCSGAGAAATAGGGAGLDGGTGWRGPGP